jgi:hypothetical protein
VCSRSRSGAARSCSSSAGSGRSRSAWASSRRGPCPAGSSSPEPGRHGSFSGAQVAGLSRSRPGARSVYARGVRP